MSEQPEPSPIPVFARLVSLLGDPESDLEDIVTAFASRPDWSRELVREASLARGSAVKTVTEAILLLGFTRTRRLLTDLGPRAVPPRAATAEADAP